MGHSLPNRLQALRWGHGC